MSFSNPAYVPEGESLHVQSYDPDRILISNFNPEHLTQTGMISGYKAGDEEQILATLEHENIHQSLARNKQYKAFRALDNPIAKAYTLSGARKAPVKEYLESMERV